RLAHLDRRGAAAHGERKIPAVAAAHAKGRAGAACDDRARWRRGLLVERIGEEIGLRRGLWLLLFLEAAEKQIEQAFGRRHGWRQPERACECCGGNKHHAAPHALTRQLCTQRLLHPTQRNLLEANSASARVTIMRDGKRAMSERWTGAKKCGSSPSPALAGEGWGGGANQVTNARALGESPHPPRSVERHRSEER